MYIDHLDEQLSEHPLRTPVVRIPAHASGGAARLPPAGYLKDLKDVRKGVRKHYMYISLSKK